MPDPKLPVMDVYIVPKHIYEKFNAKEVTKHDGLDGVGSGPYHLTEFKKGQFARFEANPNYWRGEPPLAAVVIRNFNNAETMVAALRRGEIDAAHAVTSAAYDRLEGEEGIELVEGNQGAFNEFAINGGDGPKKGHPALSDPLVRQAIAHAIDKRTIVDRVEGHATVADTISPSANPAWMPEIPDDQKYEFDLDKANALLDEGGYEDTDGDGVREMPGGGQPLKMRYAVRSESPSSQPTAEFITGWLKDIGIATTQKVYDDGQLTELILKGDYDMFVWGWVPFVDPDPMLSYMDLRRDRVTTTTRTSATRATTSSTSSRRSSSIRTSGWRSCTRCSRGSRAPPSYIALYTYPDLQAYRTDKFEGFVRQPEGTGPVLFSNSSPTYQTLKPVSATTGGAAGTAVAADDDGGLGGAGIAGIVVLALALAGAAAWAVMRRRTADERE